jgi:DAK2 domain fusion protein YloV
LRDMLDAVVNAASDSVDRTPSLLPALRLAGVVDAGGFGLLTLFEGIQRYVRGETTVQTKVRRAALEQTEEPEEGFGYDIQFILHGETLNVEAIRQHVAGMGESTLVVGDEHTVKVHTHAPNPGPVLDYGATLGPLSHIIVENMQQQFREFRESGRTNSPARPVQELMATQSTTAAQLTGISTVVVASGPGFEKLLKSLDCGAIVPGGQTMNPSTQQILAAIESVPTDKVIVLPNNKNIIMTANEARHLTSKSVIVIPTTTIPQGIAALLALNYDADMEANQHAMEQAAARVRTGEITTAVRTSHIDGMDVQKGEIIGLVDDRLVATGVDVETVVMDILSKMCGDDVELLTFYYGNGTQADEAHALVQHVRQAYPQLETETVEGGQPHYMYVISAE